MNSHRTCGIGWRKSQTSDSTSAGNPIQVLVLHALAACVVHIVRDAGQTAIVPSSKSLTEAQIQGRAIRR